jgi:alkylation response protein AidB-like acyl-CoA dehydrogenase
MNFKLTEAQLLLRNTARDFLEKECPISMVRQMLESKQGYSSDLWQKMTDLGWLGLAFPVQYGGGGGNFIDLVVLQEEIGRSLLPGPFFNTVVLGGLYILGAGSEKQKEEYLPAIANGSAVLTMALNEPDDEYNAHSIATEAVLHQGNYSINGIKLFVPYVDIADYILYVARTEKSTNPREGITAFILDARANGITCKPLPTMSRDHHYEVRLEKTTVSEQNILGRLNHGWKDVENTMQKAIVALCADMNGGAQKILELTISYAGERVQFGHPIGSLTAIQHHCADMAILLEASRSLTYEAAWRISRGLPCNSEAYMAKAWANECYVKITQLALLIHGGVGFINDHNLPLYYKRAMTTGMLLGDTDSCLEEVACSLLGHK